MEVRKLFITADDFGYCPERNRGIIDCFLKGGITDTSLMVNANYTQQAVEMGIQHKLPMGLHFNMSEGVPVAATNRVQSLVNGEGLFIDKKSTKVAAESGNIDKDEVEKELTAQLEKFKTLTGNYPARVDGHQHLHVFPVIREVFAELYSTRFVAASLLCPAFLVLVKVLHSYNISLTRVPHDLSISESDWMDPVLEPFLSDVAKYAVECLPLFTGHGIRSSEAFIGGSMMNFNSQANLTLSHLQSVMKTVPSTCKTIELMVHPSYANRTPDGGCGAGPDEFSRDICREWELQFLVSNELNDYLDQNNMQKSSWEF